MVPQVPKPAGVHWPGHRGDDPHISGKHRFSGGRAVNGKLAMEDTAKIAVMQDCRHNVCRVHLLVWYFLVLAKRSRRMCSSG